MNKKLVLLTLTTSLFLVGCLNKVEPGKIVAKVGRTVYSVDDVNNRISYVRS